MPSSLDGAKKGAEKGNTEQVEKIRPSVDKAVFGVSIILFLLVGTYGWKEYRDNPPPPSVKVVAAQSTTATYIPLEEMTQTLPPLAPNSDSAHYTVPVGYAANFGGPVGYTIHCVYRSPTGGVGRDQTQPCPNGDMLYVYVHNETIGVLEGITYRAVRPPN